MNWAEIVTAIAAVVAAAAAAVQAYIALSRSQPIPRRIERHKAVAHRLLLLQQQDLRINTTDGATTGGLPLQNAISGYFA